MKKRLFWWLQYNIHKNYFYIQNFEKKSFLIFPLNIGVIYTKTEKENIFQQLFSLGKENFHNIKYSRL